MPLVTLAPFLKDSWEKRDDAGSPPLSATGASDPLEPSPDQPVLPSPAQDQNSAQPQKKDGRDQSDELIRMVSMMTRTIRTLTSTAENSVRNLDSIAVELKAASSQSNIQVLRQRLAKCLRNVEQQAARERRATQSRLEILNREMVSSKDRLSTHGIAVDLDPVTGFPGRTAAEIAIQEACHSAEPGYLLITVLAQLDAVNHRFGYLTGDEMLFDFASMLAGKLCARASLFRWSGPSIVAILQSADSDRMLQADVAKMLENPVTKFIAGDAQTALIRVSPAWQIIRLTAPASKIVSGLDKFIGNQMPFAAGEATGNSPDSSSRSQGSSATVAN